MELDEFIKNTLIGIKIGLKSANEELAKKEGKILGENTECDFVMRQDNGTSGKINNAIDFDVAVTVSQSTEGKISGGIKIAVVDIGSHVGTTGISEHISRIKFSVYPWHIIG